MLKQNLMQDMAYILAVGYVGVSILLCGLFVRPSQLKIRPLLWLSYLSYPRQVYRTEHDTFLG